MDGPTGEGQRATDHLLTRATASGKKVADIAEALLVEAGFEVVKAGVARRDLGLQFPFLVSDAAMGRQWYVDVAGAFTNARPSMAPTFGVDPLLGTNPIAFGAPSDEEFPFLYDAATSITQRGKIEVLDRAEKPTPAGWVIDREGKTATDTKAILEGLKKKENAFVPLGGIGETLGGHKGYDLATMVEILSASLQGGMFLRALSGFNPDGSPRPHRLGHFFMAIDIEHFVPLDQSKRTTGEILRALRNLTKMPEA